MLNKQYHAQQSSIDFEHMRTAILNVYDNVVVTAMWCALGGTLYGGNNQITCGRSLSCQESLGEGEHNYMMQTCIFSNACNTEKLSIMLSREEHLCDFLAVMTFKRG